METIRLCRCCSAPVDYLIFKCTHCGQFYSRYSQKYYENEKYLKDNNITDLRKRKDTDFDTDHMCRGMHNTRERAQNLLPVLFEFGLDIDHISGGNEGLSYLMLLKEWVGYYPVYNIAGLINYVPVFEDEFASTNILTVAYSDKTIRRIILDNMGY